MKKPLLLPSLVSLLLGAVAASMPGCKSSGTSGHDDDGGAHSADATGGDGFGGQVDPAGGANPAGGGSATSAGAPDRAGSPGQGEGGAPTTAAYALPTTTFLYVRSVTPDTDELVSLDYATGDTRVVTDLTGDGSNGWEIWGHSISPDRTRIALASLYAPTKADNATGLATRRLFTLAANGDDFQRLTPVFENDGVGKTNYSIDVQGPVFSQDGQSIIYEYGNWWYEGTKLQGGSSPWFIATEGGLPQLFPTTASCTIVDPSVNPATGDVLLVHSVCVKEADTGIFLYPSTGEDPIKLVARSYGPNGVDPSLQKASWLADGSGFVFVGSMEVTRGETTDVTGSLLAYDMANGNITVLLQPDVGDVRDAAIAPNGDGIVYCLAHDDVYDLHAIDLTMDPPVDIAITDDGISCSPVF